MAKSLLEALVRVISDASLTVEILLLLKHNKERFLELLNACTVIGSGQGSRISLTEETEQHLADRIEEIEEFQTVKARVLTFTRMCDLIQPGVFSPFLKF